jgi:uncharacterized protein (TIGR04255 family)
MPEIARFEPIFPAHAIERCSITIMFDQELPAKAFQKVLDQAMPVFRNAGYENVGLVVGVSFDARTGRVGPITGPAPANYISADRSTNFLLAPNSLSIQTGRYVRWRPFIGQFNEMIGPIVPGYSDTINIQGVQLEYLDRFFWMGNWDDIEWRSLLKEGSEFIAGVARQARRQWHCHTGWFEPMTAELRRLVNVNLDVADAVRPGEAEARPSVGILTLIRDHVPTNPGEPVPHPIEPDTVVPSLENLHRDLKILLSRIITTHMTDRIQLHA